MTFRPLTLVVAALLAIAPVQPAAAQATGTESAASQAITDDELLRVTALDEVFTEFGAGIERAPLEQSLPFPSSLGVAWSAAAREVFDADGMHRALADAMRGKFAPVDYEVYAEFYGSDFGRRVSDVERAVTSMPAERQMQARELGIELASKAAATRRSEQIDEMLDLVSADITTAMIRQSVRGMLIGMSMTSQQGDIEVPWEDIDAQLDIMMPDIEADVALTQRAMMFFAYQDLGDDDLESYLEFLRTDAGRKFYAVAAFAIGEIVTQRMERFGETLARKLDQVNV